MNEDEAFELYERGERHQKGLAQAKKRAEWELGDEDWAGIIVGAYLHPEQDAVALEKEKENT